MLMQVSAKNFEFISYFFFISTVSTLTFPIEKYFYMYFNKFYTFKSLTVCLSMFKLM